MADDSTMQEKTEEATPKKRDDARKEGQVPRSQELNTAVLLLGASLVLTVLAPSMASGIRDIFGHSLYLAGGSVTDAHSGVAMVRSVGWRALAAVSPVLVGMAAVALFITSIQARGVLSPKPLGPNWKKLNPITNAKRMIGVQPWAELAKSLLKMLIIGVAVYYSLSRAWPEIVALSQQSPLALLEVARRYGTRLLMTAGTTYLVLAGADYAYQLWQHEKQLRMTKQEVKDEAKQSDGDPMVKARLRSFGRQLARRQMFRDVPTADVVVTNPTHIAVALRYDPLQSDAPVVVAMGQRKVAERIKALAQENGVPLVENKPLARALLASARVGMSIPVELYMAVAEVLAFVFKQRSARGDWPGSAVA
jgi:flagellar biosynthesis protein FlhB